MKRLLLIIILTLFSVVSLDAKSLSRAQETFIKNIKSKMTTRSRSKVPQIVLRRIAFEKKRSKGKSSAFIFELYALAINSSFSSKSKSKSKSKTKTESEDIFNRLKKDLKTLQGIQSVELMPLFELFSNQGKGKGLLDPLLSELIKDSEIPLILKNHLYQIYINRLVIVPRDKIVAFGEWLRLIRESEKISSYEEALARIHLSNEFIDQSRPEEALDQKEAAISIVETQLNEKKPIDPLTFIELLRILNKEQQNTLAQKLLGFFNEQIKERREEERIFIRERTALVEFEIFYPEKNFESILALIPIISSKITKMNKEKAGSLFAKIFDIYSEAPELNNLEKVFEAFVLVFGKKVTGLKAETRELLLDNLVALASSIDSKRSYKYLDPLYQPIEALLNLPGAIEKPNYALLLGEIYQRVGRESQALEIFRNCYIRKFSGFKLKKEHVKCLRLETYLLIRSGKSERYENLAPKIEQLLKTYNFEDPVEKTRLRVSVALNHLINSRFKETIDVLDRIKLSLSGDENVYFKSIYDIYSAAVFNATGKEDEALKRADEIENLFVTQFGKNVSTLNIPYRIRTESFLLKKDVKQANQAFVEMQRYYRLNKPYIHFDRVLGLLRGLSLAYLIKSDSLVDELVNDFDQYCGLGDQYESYKDLIELWKVLFNEQKTGKKEPAKTTSLMQKIAKNFGENNLLVFMNKKFVKVLTEK